MANEQNLKKFSRDYQPPPENKRKPKRKTIIKKALENNGITWKDAETLVEKNILEFLCGKNKKDRMYATKYFAEFVKPKKREHSGELETKVNVAIIYSDKKEIKD